VYLPITNIEKSEVVKFDYCRAKALQEEALAGGNVPLQLCAPRSGWNSR
jgi:hypothetical protein